jgi:anti-sigma factor RsiW
MLAYARGEVDAFDREIIEGHLEECPDCQADIRDIRGFHDRQSRFPPRVYAPERASYRPASIRNWKHAPPRLFLIPLAGATALAVILAIRVFAPPSPPAPGP